MSKKPEKAAPKAEAKSEAPADAHAAEHATDGASEASSEAAEASKERPKAAKMLENLKHLQLKKRFNLLLLLQKQQPMPAATSQRSKSRWPNLLRVRRAPTSSSSRPAFYFFSWPRSHSAFQLPSITKR